MLRKILVYLSLAGVTYGCRIQKMEKASLQMKVDSLKTQLVESKLSNAETYYALAQTVDEIANHTMFAPARKRNAKVEALKLYKMSAVCGKLEAKEKVRKLEQKARFSVAIEPGALNPIAYQKK